MTDAYLKQAMQPEVLDQAWRMLRNEHTPWSVTVTRDQLQQHLLEHVLRCRAAVLAGCYRPAPLRQFTMRKPNGKQRIISAHYLQDKLVQRALLIVLEAKAEALFHNDSYAYRRGRSVDMALNKSRERIGIGQDWLVDADIASFFDSIPIKRLQKKLKGFIKDAATLALMEQWLKQGVHHSSLLGRSRGIAQGSVLSPLFCNLYLHEFDTALSRAHIPFVRFADDFLLFSVSQAKAKAALDFAQVQLQQLGLEIHPDKTRITRSSPKVSFLGQRLPAPAAR